MEIYPQPSVKNVSVKNVGLMRFLFVNQVAHYGEP